MDKKPSTPLQVRCLLEQAEFAMIKAERMLAGMQKLPPIMAADRHLSDAMRLLRRSDEELVRACSR